MSREITLKGMVLDYMKKNKRGITSWEAIKEFGATRLSAIIYDLKRDGYDIVSKMEVSKNRYGYPVKYSRYSLVDVEQKTFWERLKECL